MSKRNTDFDKDICKCNKKSKVKKMYRWYGVTDCDMVQVFEGNGPPTKCFTREVYGPDNTGDVNFSFCSNGECENADEITVSELEDMIETYLESGMLFRGPIPDPDDINIDEYGGDIPEERELLDCQDE
jgi:hypothetical protein